MRAILLAYAIFSGQRYNLRVMKRTANDQLQIARIGIAPGAVPIFRLLVVGLLASLLFTACNERAPDDSPLPPTATPPAGNTAEAVQDPTSAPEASPTTPPPTPTPQLAAMVNGQPILLEAYEAELLRYEKGMAELGLTPGADGQDYQRLVLDALIERELISQAARAAGISITPDLVEAKLVDLRQSTSEEGSFESWLAVNQWTEDEFKEALASEMLVEAMIAEITADVPFTAEQVRASYIQLDDAALAESLLSQINEGADFGDLAARYSRDSVTGPAGGDLGFFARGSLLVPEVEDVAYQLELEEVSDIVTVTDSESGKVTYYIVQVTERDPDRPLNTDLRYQLLQERFNSWLDEQWANATILNLLGEE